MWKKMSLIVILLCVNSLTIIQGLNPGPNPFLIGDNTPIYLAYRDDYGGVRYQQVPHDPSMRVLPDHRKNAVVAPEKQVNQNLNHGINDNNVEGNQGYPINWHPNNIVQGQKRKCPYAEWYEKQMAQKKKDTYQDAGMTEKNNNNVGKYPIYQPNWNWNNGIAVPQYGDPRYNEQNMNPNWNSDSNVHQYQWNNALHKMINVFPSKPVHNRRKRYTVDTVYPEILVVVDNGFLRQHNNDYKEVVKNLVMVWSGIDLIYRTVQYPKIRLNIAGIVIPMESGAEPYFERNILYNGTINGGSTLSAVKNYFRDNDFFQNKNYDVVAALTSLDIRDGYSDISGLGTLNAPCGPNAVALAEINGAAAEVSIAHELGHNFGANHDGSGFSNCPSGEYTMGPVSSGSETSFSACSQRSFWNYFTNSEHQCYRNKPLVQNSYPVILRGQLISLDEQCRTATADGRYYNFRAYNTDESVCSSLKCIGPDSTIMGPLHAYNGSPCGPNKICLERQCVSEW